MKKLNRYSGQYLPKKNVILIITGERKEKFIAKRKMLIFHENVQNCVTFFFALAEFLHEISAWLRDDMCITE